MQKYIDELKKVTWPESNEVMAKFAIVVFGIIVFAIFFLIADAAIASVVGKIYQ